MGAYPVILHRTRRMKTLFVLAICIASGSAMYDSWESIPVDEVKESNPVEDFEPDSVQALLQEVKHLSDVSSPHAALSLHAQRIAKHAKLLQSASSKAKAYAHNFANSKNAIRSALRALTGQLNTGHKHDVNALRSERNRGNSIITGAHTGGKNKVAGFRNKACPTKRLEQEAKAKRVAAHRAANGVGNGKICSGGLSTTYGDMDIEKAVPKFGTELRNKWDKARSKYHSSLGKYKVAKKAHSDALKKYNVAMAQFRTALSIEVSNAIRACKNAHHEYEALKKEVASNVKSRKNVFISTLVITCYVDNITSTHSAKVCADKKRRASTSQWNINGHSLNRCHSKAHLTNSFGPASWTPSTKTCHAIHWHAGAKATFSCMYHAAGSNNAGVVRAKTMKGYTNTGGGMTNNYRSWDAKSAFEEAYPVHGKYRCDTGFGPGRLTCYNIQCKSNKGLTCITRHKHKNGSGMLQVNLPYGYTMTGGGLFNHYRHWNKQAGFEVSQPQGDDAWQGDMGFGKGEFSVFVRGCKPAKGHKFVCKTMRTGYGNYHSVNCPKGFQRTGCGINNAYRHWNKLSGFETVNPNGHNGCTCDTGFGTGKNVCTARCCKIV